jgi:RNA exonuclease 1
MPSASKKYKLYSSANDNSGKKPICSFFASEAGCRNGASCKFSHGSTSSEKLIVASHEIMRESSESSESEAESPFASKEESPFVSKAELPFVPKATSITSPASSRTTTEDAIVTKGRLSVEEDEIKLDNSYSSLAKPARKRKSSHVIAKPKNKKKSLSSDDVGLQVKEEQEGSSKSLFSFRALNLPVAAPPAVLLQKPNEATSSSPKENKNSGKKTIPTKVKDAAKPALPLPNSASAGTVWRDLVKRTQAHQRFNGNYDFLKYIEQDEVIGYASNTWVKTSPFAKSKTSHPQVIAIDCEMCEAEDPVSGKKDARALCRVSVIDVATDEVLLDSLVKPMWPITDYRDWINGITAESLEKVQFTLRHAQAFMKELCSEETVIIGHAIHNDLAALRVEHYCCVDSALLYKAIDSERATVALRDLSKSILGKEMPTTHDSVNDARVAIACVEHFRKHDGDVEAVVRTPKPQKEGGEHSDRSSYKQLFIHRIPAKTCSENHLEAMFLEHTNIRPEVVDKIEFNEKGQGRTHVHFTSGDHAKLAFDCLRAKPEIENSGRLQKNIYLRDGNYIRVRMMTSERK